MTYRILLTPGDGIGPEVIDDTRRVLGWFSANRNMSFETSEAAIGGIAYETLVHRSRMRPSPSARGRCRAVRRGRRTPMGRAAVREEAGARLLRLRKDSACSPTCGRRSASTR